MGKMKCAHVMGALERIAPRALAEDWDNPGLLLGSFSQEVNKIFVALDVSDEVAARAVELGADMIIAHHPLIFHGLKKLRTDRPLGRRLALLLTHGIAVAAAHTNLDAAEGGVNDVLAGLIGLKDVKPFPEGEGALGRMGTLAEPLSAEDFAALVRDALPVEHVRLVKAGEKRIKKVALVSGAGAEFIPKAAFAGADAFLTGDVKYHEAQTAVEEGLHVVDGGHFGTEFPVAGVLAARLADELKKGGYTPEIIADTTSKDLFTIV